MINSKTRWICINAIGIAMFVVFSMCLQVPVFENYYLCLGYVVMAVYCYFYGAASGTIIGVVGVILYCLLISGLRGMPGWALGNVVIGIILGVVLKWTRTSNRLTTFGRVFFSELAIWISTAVGILLVKSLTESLLYAQPFLLRLAKNHYAFIADGIVLVLSYPICVALTPIWNRYSDQ